ncbi:MAG: TrmH family RNA methyltransferase [Planctomycetota bacterium]|jgi:TrmH family RNA methyltransferase
MSDPPITKAQTKLLADLGGAAGRRRESLCLVEGAVLLREVLAVGLVPSLVAYAPEAAAVEAARAGIDSARAAGATVVELSERAAARLSGREHAPGLLAAVPLPPAWKGPPAPSGPTLLVAVCGVQDPGNVGTLLRSAVAFAAEAMLVTPGSADPFGPKVVRASAGAALRLPCAATTPQALAELAGAADLVLCAAMPPARDGEATGEREGSTTLPARCLLALGHETRGLPPLAGARSVSVLQSAAAESLNVAMAGSILMSGWYATHAPSRSAP